MTADQAARLALDYADELRTFTADRLDEQKRCADWARRTAQEQAQ